MISRNEFEKKNCINIQHGRNISSFNNFCHDLNTWIQFFLCTECCSLWALKKKNSYIYDAEIFLSGKKGHCSINFTYLKLKPNVKVLFISLFICKVFALEKYGSISKTSGYFWRSFFSLQFRRKVRMEEGGRSSSSGANWNEIGPRSWKICVIFCCCCSPFFFVFVLFFLFLFVSVVMTEELKQKNTRSFVAHWHIRICNEIFSPW